MRVCLVYPEVIDIARLRERRKEFPPFGVLYLAAVLECEGHEVRILPVDDRSPALDLTRFDFVGYSVASSATFNLLAETHRRASYRRGVRVAIGGVHVNFYPELSLRQFGVRLGGVGDFDDGIVGLVEAIDDDACQEVPGAVWLTESGHFGANPPRSHAVDLDALPSPARHLLSRDRVVMDDRLAGTSLRMVHAMFSRGCPYGCHYCAVANTTITYRNGQSAATEMGHAVREYAIDGFAIVDDNFIVDRRRVSDIAQAIGPLGLRWSALSRIEPVTDELLTILAASGCIELKYGIESGSEDQLRRMGKRTKLARVKATVRATRAAGIGVKAFLVHGFPGETLETSRATIRLLDDLGDAIERVSLFRFVPLPGTHAYEQWRHYDIRGTHHQPGWDGDWSKFHIHYNDRHWWGDAENFREVERGYRELADYVNQRWKDAAPQ